MRKAKHWKLKRTLQAMGLLCSSMPIVTLAQQIEHNQEVAIRTVNGDQWWGYGIEKARTGFIFTGFPRNGNIFKVSGVDSSEVRSGYGIRIRVTGTNQWLQPKPEGIYTSRDEDANGTVLVIDKIGGRQGDKLFYGDVFRIRGADKDPWFIARRPMDKILVGGPESATQFVFESPEKLKEIVAKNVAGDAPSRTQSRSPTFSNLTIYVCYGEKSVNRGCSVSEARICNNTNEARSVNVTTRGGLMGAESTKQYQVAPHANSSNGPFLGYSEYQDGGICRVNHYTISAN